MTEISLCNCDWTGDGALEQPCGCGSHDVRLYRDTAYHYAGGHWRADCRIKQPAGERDELKRRVEELERKLGSAVG